ncbi:hypothetical protein O3P69_004054 [Scylla paramamosain]|uniref:Uncharacterized protein n=1 Tax=Scylla paramamosain TaxID=85552 RepID=A0AAW0UEU4_SCYPA
MLHLSPSAFLPSLRNFENTTTTSSCCRRRRRRRRRNQAGRSLRLMYIHSTDSLCGSCRISETLFATFFWLGYFNSCLNPFIYACTSREFKRAFKRILCRGRGRGRRSLNHATFHSAIWRRDTGGLSPNPSSRGIEGLLATTMPLADPCGAVWKAPKALEDPGWEGGFTGGVGIRDPDSRLRGADVAAGSHSAPVTVTARLYLIVEKS